MIKITDPLNNKNIGSSSLSSASSSISIEKSAAIAQRQGVLWKCEDRFADGPGYIYRFRIRPEYDPSKGQEGQLYSKNMEIFPSVEFTPKMLSHHINGVHYSEILQSLGYKYEEDSNGYYLDLPDKEVLEARFENLRRILPHLNRPLKILSSDGIAGDMPYTKAYINGYDALLSSGQEFGHDHIHMITVIQLMIIDPDYIEHRLASAEVVRKPYKRIRATQKVIQKQLQILPQEKRDYIVKYLPKIEASLGVRVDLIWSSRMTSELINVTQEYDLQYGTENMKFLDQWDDPKYKQYGQRRFGDAVEIPSLRDAWRDMEELEKNQNLAFVLHKSLTVNR